MLTPITCPRLLRLTAKLSGSGPKVPQIHRPGVTCGGTPPQDGVELRRTGQPRRVRDPGLGHTRDVTPVVHAPVPGRTVQPTKGA